MLLPVTAALCDMFAHMVQDCFNVTMPFGWAMLQVMDNIDRIKIKTQYKNV